MMQAQHSARWIGWLLVPAVWWSSAALRADERGQTPPRRGRALAAVRTATAAQDGYWIGIMGAPIDPLLQSHLRLDAGVVVQQVVPDSPAQKAGIQEGDILLKFGDAPIRDVQGLAEAVSNAGDKEVKLTLLREGNKQTIAVTPAKRPARLPAPPLPQSGEWRRFREWMEKLERGELPDAPFNMWFAQPGVVLPRQWKDWQRGMIGPPKAALRLPADTSVSITKSGEGPATIVVTKDGKTWTVTEDKIDTLPDDVQQIVKGLIGGGVGFVVPGPDGTFRFDRDGRPFRYRLRPAPRSGEPDAQGSGQPKPQEAPADTSMESVRKKLDEMNRRLREKEKEMQREMEKMRQEIDKLKKTEV